MIICSRRNGIANIMGCTAILGDEVLGEIMFKLQNKLEKYAQTVHGEDFSIRNATIEDLRVAIEWAAKEGWNPGLHDAEPFWAADPTGFFVGELNRKPVVFVSAVLYDETFGFMGLYIVNPEYRSKGYGLSLFKAAFDYLGDRNIGGDGVVAQLENYKKLGCDIAYKNFRYEGRAEMKPYENVSNLSTLPFEAINAYDRKIFLAPRKAFLKQWIAMPDSYAIGAAPNGTLHGYGVLRKCFNGWKVGPLFADSQGIARNILNALLSKIPGECYFLDIPEPNQAALELVRENNMKICFETARMYTQKPPAHPLNHIFGVTTFELG
jgi:GNAT superfamily N-acetyltransferase